MYVYVLTETCCNHFWGVFATEEAAKAHLKSEIELRGMDEEQIEDYTITKTLVEGV